MVVSKWLCTLLAQGFPLGLSDSLQGEKNIVVVVELIVSNIYYCCSLVWVAAILLLVPLLFSQNFASRSGTAIGPRCVRCCCVFVSFKTWVKP